MKMDNLDNLVKRTKEPYDPSIECDKCGSEIDFEKLLCKYGTEGLYDIANKLIKIADEDISDALNNNYF